MSIVRVHNFSVSLDGCLGRGERLWNGLDDLEACFEVESVSTRSGVTHLTFTRQDYD